MKTVLTPPRRAFGPALLLCGLFAAAPAEAAETSAPPRRNLAPFVVPWPRESKPLVDLSFLNPAPAGKDGFIRARDGHLVYGNGERFRIWGLNATAQATLPAKEDAPVVAANLARVGVNCIRFHFLDRTSPTGLIDNNRPDSRALDPQQLDKLDFFIAELKQRGIYSDLNLNVGRTYKPGDGVRDADLLGFPKALTYFDERLIELQKEYARQLLTHVNRYTGAAYAKEPAVALVEFVNENSLVESWFSDRLLGEQTEKPSDTWHDIPASYARALTDKYNQWLARRFPPETVARFRQEANVGPGEPVPRLRRAQFDQASKERFHAEASFYMEVERGFFLELARYLREELGVKPLLLGTSDHNHSRSGYPLLASASLLDVVDGHVYWQHPRYLKGESGRRAGFEIQNTPMVDAPLNSTVVQLSRSAVAGKPYIVSEVNHPFPAESACEGVPILAAYAAFQDWDGLFWYTLAHKDVLALPDKVGGHFDFAKDPVKMAQLAAGALTFLRPDVRPAARTVVRSYSAEQVRESLRLPNAQAPYFTPGFPLSLPLEHAVRVSSFDSPATASFSPATQSPYAADTGELRWSATGKQTGLIVVDTPRSQALVGHFKNATKQPLNLNAEPSVSFGAITLNSLGTEPIASNTKLLLTATAAVSNTGMTWNAKRTSLENWGAAPTQIEPVAGRIRLCGLDPARSLSVQPLTGAAEALGKPIAATRDGNDWFFSIGTPVATSFLIVVGR